MLEETAAAGGESGTDALFALVLLYNREKRYDEAPRGAPGTTPFAPP